MKILILEDDAAKASRVREEVQAVSTETGIHTEVVLTDNFRDYVALINRDKFDLIIADLLVPRAPEDADASDMTVGIIETTRDMDSPNFRTPVVALTKYDAKAEENFKDLNSKDITVITFDGDSADWSVALSEKIRSCIPPIRFDFVIVCALAKEVGGFLDAGYTLGDQKVLNGLACRELKIQEWKGVVVTPPRMGLVDSAIVSTQALLHFRPRLICMSGICGGVPEKAKIYDVVVPEMCHQNDAGKWTASGFEPEVYTVQLDHALRTKIEETIAKSGFKERVGNGITLNRPEFPDGIDKFAFDVIVAPTSSGNSVLAHAKKVKGVAEQHRKLAAFEMESYAVYEAARLDLAKPLYFSAKAVVDDGSSSKGDRFHRVACILAARVVHELVEGVMQLRPTK